MSEHQNASLALDAERMRRMGYEVVDRLVERYHQLPELGVWQPGDRAELETLLRTPPPQHPRHIGPLLDTLFDHVLTRGARVDHPRFLAFVPGAPTWPAVLGDFIAAGCDIFQGTWLASAGVSTIELVVLDWFRQWLGLPEGAGGLLVSGGSVANLTALACAREARHAGEDAVLYLSHETHSSVFRAARVLGFRQQQLRVVGIDQHDRMHAPTLRREIETDLQAGRRPFCLIANAGTTSTGAIDPLADLAAIAREHGLWFHVDGAYGGFAALTQRGKALLHGIEHADSLTLDPHKWLYQPFEVGCVLVREPALLRQAFHVLPAYLQDTALAAPQPPELDRTSPVNFGERGIQLTRTARALKIWLSLNYFGTGTFCEAIDRCFELALQAEAYIMASPAFELLRPASLGIVCFRRRAASDDAADALNARALAALGESGLALISSTRVDGHFALRFCILNYRTSWDDLRRVLEFLEQAA